jgi:hypothetical protein
MKKPPPCSTAFINPTGAETLSSVQNMLESCCTWLAEQAAAAAETSARAATPAPRSATSAKSWCRAPAELVNGHSFRQVLIAADSKTAAAKICMAAAALPYASGVVIDGFAGHLSRMTGGMSGGSISSTVSVSALVILPWAS